ncbi:serine hydrolase domain-containing protein [Kribbella shirazensis]|uniref:D-alanyl-D-alanine carboxypeptidase n=1 Tax=Kribbella shirazensis TaxID=1105143 RepID=A0A7X5ZYM3_9ACTN|nr:serine hydrolase domain-containing protein [Kribbella shirazensis]NIK54800.1 D-alanyl-D-alanine carboxypeptidase [Kribbella shirazensis]
MLVALVTAAAMAVGPSVGAASPKELQEGLDGVVAIGALAEVRDGGRVWRGSSGVAELDSSRKVPVAGRFRIGSVTKTFVATVVLQLVAEKRIRLDDSVERWLPGVVPNGANITVRHLLNHTSGLYDFKDTLPMPPSEEFYALRYRTWTASEQIERALANPPMFNDPGSRYEYSNTNYLLIGEIIEKVTGRTYAEEIEGRVIRPLHLHGTTLPGTSPYIKGPHPHGYVPKDGGMIDYTELNPTLFGASGDMISTTRDLNRFFAALLGGHLLPANLLEEMKTPGTENGRYGLGLTWHDTACKVRVYGNDGDALAYQAYSFSTEDTRRQATVAVTPHLPDNPDDSVDAFLDRAFCG